MSSSLHVRDATADDLSGIVRVYLRAYAQPPWNETNDPVHTQQYVRWLMGQPGMHTLVAPLGAPESDQAEQIGGFVMASAPRAYQDFVGDWEHMADRPPEGWPVVTGVLGYIWELAVDPDAQRRGIGSAMMATALERLKVAGAERVILRSSERADAAMALYRKFGFVRVPVRERKDPLAGPWVVELRPSGPPGPAPH
ncbi:MAG TPA: N-acetyltransferase [Chloroflexota bacterium]|nr:N-acetyltransferase [Chloroflexota bacterium]